MLDLLSPVGLLALGRWSLAAVARRIAASLQGVADALDGGPAREREQARASDADEATAGTRQRIGEVLERARTQYDAMSTPTGSRPPATRRPRTRR
jgi:hypothetical protein